MIRPATAFWAAAVIGIGYVMFQMKYEVMHQEDQLARVNHQIAETREAIRVLKAEWSFLSRPSRLSALSQRYLHLVPIETAELGAIDTIPLRDPPPPLPAPKPPQSAADNGARLAQNRIGGAP
jgi:cell division protein FtsL